MYCYILYHAVCGILEKFKAAFDTIYKKKPIEFFMFQT